MYKILLLLFFFVFCSCAVSAQPSSAKVVDVDGAKYYEHTIESGNTMWSLQQLYGVTLEELLKSNPSLSEGLKLDQKILILVSEVETPEIRGGTTDYIVKNKETLYGLSKKFNLSVDGLITLNPELKDGLRKGQVIKVPYSEVERDVDTPEPIEETTYNPFVSDSEPKSVEEELAVTFSDTTVSHVVLSHETMYSISKRFMVKIERIMEINDLNSANLSEGQVLIIPVKNERVSKVLVKEVPGNENLNWDDSLVFESKEEYNIVLILPLHLDYGKEYSKYVSNLSAQFYMGAKLAIDSLERKGLKAKVHIFDTQGDSNVIVNLFTKTVFDNVDLVIGPLLNEDVAQVALLCRERGIRMVCPVKIDGEVLKNNPLVYSSVTSNITLMRGLAEHISRKSSSDNVILVKPDDVKSIAYYEEFQRIYGEIASDNSPSLVLATQGNFSSLIRKRNKSLFVMPTTNKKSALNFINTLNRSSFRSDPGDIIVYGMKEWEGFSSINNIYKNKYKFHYASPNFLDYNSEEMIAVNRVYRESYNTDMSKVAIQGYDVLSYFCNYFFLDSKNDFSLMNDFHMKQIGQGHGNENFKSFIISQEEFELFNIEE